MAVEALLAVALPEPVDRIKEEGMNMDTIIEQLLQSPEPAVRFKLLVNVLGKDPRLAEMAALQQEIKTSPRIQTMLQTGGGEGVDKHHPYAKWNGAHWVLSILADIGYPPGDPALLPLRELELGWLLGEEHTCRIRQVTIAGRVRMCASMEGNALFSLCALGLADERAGQLAERLLAWQWRDGGWNCDKRPEARTSSFHETLTPLRGLIWFARLGVDQQVRQSVERAAEVFLSRHLFKHLGDGSIIEPEFIRLHYPCYWHYDILFALKVLAEGGFLSDPRCRAALDMLESKRLADGGFPAEGKLYSTALSAKAGRSKVDWGGTSIVHSNPWVTVDALAVLKLAGGVI